MGRALLAALLCVSPAAAQLAAPGKAPKLAKDAPALPALPELRDDSPLDALLFADRRHVSPPAASAAALPADAPPLQSTKLHKSLTGTGYKEPIEYRLPLGYDPDAGPYPMLVAYHGFGTSAASVAAQTDLDELCAVRGWIYLAPTGLDDKLFGSEPCMAHIDAAIGWMLGEFAVDPDRICMTGFSMGAAVSLQYAARRRDPAGIMIAGVGAVSGGFDHVANWVLEPAMRPWLEHPFNFGGPPGTHLFAYQRASGLHLDTSSYPPLPGTPDTALSHTRNLGGRTVRLAWDTGDPLSHVPGMGAHAAALLAACGADVTTRVVSGTVDPGSGAPAPHSWAVLDAGALLDAFEGLSVERRPAAFEALVPGEARVSWTTIHPRASDAFAALRAAADPSAATLRLDDVTGAALVEVHLDEAGLEAAWPLRLQARTLDPEGFDLRLRGGSGGPGWFVHAAGGDIVSGWEAGPEPDMLTLHVPAGAGVDALAVAHAWQARMTLGPDPAAPGDLVELELDGPPGAGVAWLVLGAHETHVELPGGWPLIVPPWAPSLLLPVPLDAAGDVRVSGQIPLDPTLSGARILLQAALQSPFGSLMGTSNPWALDIG